MSSRKRRVASFEPPPPPLPVERRSRQSSRNRHGSSTSTSTSVDPSVSRNITLYSQSQSQRRVCEHTTPCSCADILENKFYFVIPSGLTEESVSAQMKSAYDECVARDFTLEWIKERKVDSLEIEMGSMLVLDRFEGRGFKYLDDALSKNKNFMIIGPQVLNYMFQRDVKEYFQISGYPVFTLAMMGLVVSSTGIRDAAEKQEIVSKVQTMGGLYDPNYTASLTHMVASSMLSNKAVAAKKKKLPVMKPDWVNAVWNQSLTELVHATDAQFGVYEAPMFYNLNFSFSQITSKQKQILQRTIETNGGVFSADLVRKTSNVLVLPRGEGDKFRHARDWNLLCVRPEWITESCEAGYALGTSNFLVTGLDHPLSSTLLTPNVQAPPAMNVTSCSIIPLVTPSRSISRVVDSTLTSEFNSLLMTGDRDKSVKRFLDGCTIYLSGKTNLRAAMCRLEGSGALIVDILDDAVTHVVVLGDEIPIEDLEMLRLFNPMPLVVGFDWLEESSGKKVHADEEIFKFDLPQPIQEQELDAGGEGGGEVEEDSLVGYFVGNVQPAPENEKVAPGEGSSGEKGRTASSSGDQLLHQDPTMRTFHYCLGEDAGPTTPQPLHSIFEGKKFFLSFKDDLEGHERTMDMLMTIGGIVVDENFDFIIASPLHDDNSILAHPHYTEFWLVDCDEVNSIHIPEAFYHCPRLKVEGITGLLDGVVLAISAYSLPERSYISALASYMGAIIQDIFSKKAKNGVLANTHLICNTVDNEKHSAAVRWKLPVVTCDWVLKCYETRSRVDPKPFAPKPREDSTIIKIPPPKPVSPPQLELTTTAANGTFGVGGPGFHTGGIGNTTLVPETQEPDGTGISIPAIPEQNEAAGILEPQGQSLSSGGFKTPLHARVMAVAGRRLSLGAGVDSPLSQAVQTPAESPPFHYRVNPNLLWEKSPYSPMGLPPLIPMPGTPETPKLEEECMQWIRDFYKPEKPSTTVETTARQVTRAIDFQEEVEEEVPGEVPEPVENVRGGSGSSGVLRESFDELEKPAKRVKQSKDK